MSEIKNYAFKKKKDYSICFILFLKNISSYDKLSSYNYFLFKPLLASTAVSDFLPGNFYIKTAEQLIHKAAQPADVIRPLVLSISMLFP